MKERNRDEMRDEILEAVVRLPTLAALERMIVVMAGAGNAAALRRALKEIGGILVPPAASELFALNLKVRALLDAAQDGGALAAAITAAFPETSRLLDERRRKGK